MGVPRVVPAVLILALLASTAGAATIGDVTGMVKLNGQAVSGPETPFPEGARLDVVGDGSGATIVTGAGDRILLDPGARIVFSLVTEEIEVYEVMAGSFRASLSPKTAIVLPNDGRLAAVEDGTEVAVESRDGGARTAVDVAQGSANLMSGEQFTTRIGARQSLIVTFVREAPRTLGYQTGPGNEGAVEVVDRATPDLVIRVAVPRATIGRMASVDGDTRTKIENSLESARDGKLGVVTSVMGTETARGEVAPGVFAFVNHATGAIEFEYVEINFQVLKRDIGLTSAFQTLAVSNFTGVLPPDPGGGTPVVRPPNGTYD